LQRLVRCWKYLRQSARCICKICCVALLLIDPHLQTLYRSECLRLETEKTLMELCEGSCVVYAPVGSGVRPTSAAQVRTMDVCDCDLPQKQTAISLPLRRTALRRRLIAPKKMMVHSSALCSAVTATGTFGTQTGNFLARPRVSQSTKWHIQNFAVVSHSVTN